ncbi:uncharacterized protein [Lepeophtheirus salmonis]|uniref:uncharacterized protein n=1 Tax=Lepeophtheirus salmonis TaxID=72036 RepID=UPI003AF38AD5
MLPACRMSQEKERSFFTLVQRVPGLKDRLAWAMSHSSDIAKGVYTVDQDNRVSIETNPMLDNNDYLESLNTITEGLIGLMVLKMMKKIFKLLPLTLKHLYAAFPLLLRAMMVIAGILSTQK